MIYRWERVGLRTERYELLYRRLGVAEVEPARPAGAEAGSDGTRDAGAEREARNVLAWIAGTNASDDAIAEIARAASYLAEAHTRVAAGKVLAEVMALHGEVQALLRSGRQRLGQTRDLLRIDSGLLAHAGLLLGDLGQHEAARDYGTAALLFAQEAQADEAIAWSVKAKTARWQNRFVESAELARRGFEVSGPTPTRVELAYREANAIALFGDVSRARRPCSARNGPLKQWPVMAPLPLCGRSRRSGGRSSPSRLLSTPGMPPPRCAVPRRRTPAGAQEMPRCRRPGRRSGRERRWPT